MVFVWAPEQRNTNSRGTLCLQAVPKSSPENRCLVKGGGRKGDRFLRYGDPPFSQNTKQNVNVTWTVWNAYEPHAGTALRLQLTQPIYRRQTSLCALLAPRSSGHQPEPMFIMEINLLLGSSSQQRVTYLHKPSFHELSQLSTWERGE